MIQSLLSVLNKGSTRRIQELSPLDQDEPSSFFPRPPLKVEGTPDEIQDRLKNRYVNRLSDRVRKMRKELASRNWPALKLECRQLGASGDSYGLPEMAGHARQVDALIPDGEISKARMLTEAQSQAELLIQNIDTFLNTKS